MSLFKAAGTVSLLGWLAGFDPAAMLGIFSGASTNTPSLGAGTQALSTVPGLAEDRLSLPALAYAVTYPTAIVCIIGTLLLIRKIFRIDPARVAQNIRRSCITVTELADTLVRQEGLSFRQAHEIAAAVARAVVGMQGDVGMDGFGPFLAAFEAMAGRRPEIDAARFAEIVSPEYFVAVRDRLGGPAPAALERAIKGYRVALAELQGRSRRHAARDRPDAGGI